MWVIIQSPLPQQIVRYCLWMKLAKYLLLSIFAAVAPSCAMIASSDSAKHDSSPQEILAALEAKSGGRLGVFVFNSANDKRIEYRSEERFPLCSTSKVMAVAAILRKSMSDPYLLGERITFSENEVSASGFAPITEKHIESGMTVSELSAAALQYSDNAAVNLLMKKLDGPQSVTRFARSINDMIFRLNRWEPDLNSAIPGDLRDTTMPEAMANSLQNLILGDILDPSRREQLKTWMLGNTTGDDRIRAGTPRGWMVADKTGTGAYGTTNDIGIIWPPHGAPIFIAIYFTQTKKDAEPNSKTIASATRIALDSVK